MVGKPSQLSSRQVVDLPELAAYCSVLSQHVAQGGHEAELDAVRRVLVARTLSEHVHASVVIGAIELVGCPPLRLPEPGRIKRIERYTDALADLLREFMS